MPFSRANGLKQSPTQLMDLGCGPHLRRSRQADRPVCILTPVRIVLEFTMGKRIFSFCPGVRLEM